MRFMFYSHDGFGLGHTCRNLAIARSLTELSPHASVLLASGSDDVTRLGVPDHVEILKLPGLRKLANDSYASRHPGVSGRHVRRLRGRLLASAVESFRPDVLLADKHPFGARGELKAALSALRQAGGKAVLGLRDILDEPATVRAEWQAHQLPQAIPHHYDAVLVYGQRDLFDPAAAYGFPPALASRTHFCGYVSNCAGAPDVGTIGFPPPPECDPAHPLVLATVGGGEDGFDLLKHFLVACGGVVSPSPPSKPPSSPCLPAREGGGLEGGEGHTTSGWRPVAVSGPMMPGPQHTQLELLARDVGAELYSFVPGLSHWFAAAAVVVCMGGYNTLIQTLEAAAPVVCVPRVEPRREQLVRAEGFARRGLLRLVPPDRLSPKQLRREITAALDTPRAELRARIQATVQFKGAALAAEHLLTLARASGVQSRRHSEAIAVA